MSREIKFRAYNKESEEMLSSVYLIQHNWSYADLHKGDDSIIALMQFTGLHDKNGKEIYEMDVVRIANFPNDFKRGEPDFDWRVFQVIWNNNVYAFENSVIYSPFSSYNGKTLEEYDIEVIGNIYENPELIK